MLQYVSIVGKLVRPRNVPSLTNVFQTTVRMANTMI